MRRGGADAIIERMRDLFNDPRLVRYLVLNVIVSVVTALIVMSIWTFVVLRQAPEPLVLIGQEAVAEASQLQVAAVVAAGDLQSERVVIEHIGSQELSLAGWRLVDASGIEFSFPALVLYPGGQVAVHTSTGDNTASELFWNRQVAVWSKGEELTLLDANKKVQATYTVP